MAKHTKLGIIWIFLKNSIPLMLTVLIAWGLFASLGTERHLGPICFDALSWSGVKSTVRDEQPSPVDTAESPKSTAKPNLEAEAIHRILLVTTFLFIGCNTLIFLIENLAAFSCVRRKGLLYAAWVLTVVAEVLTVFWILKVYLGWDADWIFPFPDQCVAFLMFLIFCLVDCFNWRAYAANAKTAASDKKKFDEAQSNWALNQALLVDLPVIIGIAVSTYMAWHLTTHFETAHYLSGFFSGATVMHLAASQVIYTILAIRADLSE